MSSETLYLEKVPLFTLTPSKFNQEKLEAIFPKWPMEKLDYLNQAQVYRDLLCEHLKMRQPCMTRIADIDKYRPMFGSIEKEKLGNPRIEASPKHKFHWVQTPIVVEKYVERTFSANYCMYETLHLIWLKGILYMDQAFDDYEANRHEQAVINLRTAAGIFEYLASDKCRCIDKQSAPIEFQPAVFNALMNLMLGQAYLIIASKAEFNGAGKKAIGKICYAAHTSFQTANDAIKGATPIESIEPQFIHWLEQILEISQAFTCVMFAYDSKKNDEDGMAVGLLNLAINHLKKVEKIEPKNLRPNNCIKGLIATLEPLKTKWGEENFLMNNKVVANEVDATRYLATQNIAVLSVPQAVPYSQPEPQSIGSSAPPADASAAPTTPETEEGDKPVIKKIH